MQQLIASIHACPLKAVMATTGAGSSAISSLMSVAGCSKTLLRAEVPYYPACLADLLDGAPAKCVSEEVALGLSQKCFLEAAKMSDSPSAVVGLGATCAIQTDRERRGEDQAFVACWGERKVTSYHLKFDRAVKFSRETQEAAVCQTILQALADAADLTSGFEWESTEGITLAKKITDPLPDPISSLFNSSVKWVLMNRYGALHCELTPYTPSQQQPTSCNRSGDDKGSPLRLIYPGSFRPLHWGHRELATVAAAYVAEKNKVDPSLVKVVFEMSISIVGKDALDAAEVMRRISQFKSRNYRVAVTCAKLFIEKARIFPNSGFIIGIDTARRILDPQYYENKDVNSMIKELKVLKEELGCYFVVAGRLDDKTGKWDEASNVHELTPSELQGLFLCLSSEEFRIDISSTELRKRAERKSA